MERIYQCAWKNAAGKEQKCCLCSCEAVIRCSLISLVKALFVCVCVYRLVFISLWGPNVFEIIRICANWWKWRHSDGPYKETHFLAQMKRARRFWLQWLNLGFGLGVCVIHI